MWKSTRNVTEWWLQSLSEIEDVKFMYKIFYESEMPVSSVSKTFGYTHVQSSEKRWLKLRGYQVHDLVRIPSGPHNLHLSYSTVTMVTTRANVQHEEKVKKQTNKQAICFMRKTWVLHAITFFSTLVRQRERHNKQSTGFMSRTRLLHVNDAITIFGTTSL